MGLHASMTRKSQVKRIDRDQTSNPEPLPIRTLLGNEVRLGLLLHKSTNPTLRKLGRKRFREARNQLRLLDAIEYRLIQRVHGG